MRGRETIQPVPDKIVFSANGTAFAFINKIPMMAARKNSYV